MHQHLALRGIEHYLPLYRAQRKWSDGSRVTLDLPLFPGYLFVRIKRTDRVSVLQIPGVVAIVGGTGREPQPMSDSEINALRTGLLLRRAEPHPLLTVGQRARIASGVLAGMEGVILQRKNHLRIVLTVDLVRQSVSVEVDIRELEPLKAADLRCLDAPSSTFTVLPPTVDSSIAISSTLNRNPATESRITCQA